MASVAEVKAAIDAAIQQINDCQTAVRATSESLAEIQQSFAAAIEGSEHEAVNTTQAALAQAAEELEDCLAATLTAVEQAQLYMGTL